MNFLEGFELIRPSLNASRPAHGISRMIVSKNQFSFSKELAAALGSPPRIDLFKGKDENKVAITAGSTLRFCTKGEAKKVVHKEPELLGLLHSVLDCSEPGVYYCVSADFIERNGQTYAVFDLDKVERYTVDKNTLQKLGRNPQPAPKVKEIVFSRNQDEKHN